MSVSEFDPNDEAEKGIEDKGMEKHVELYIDGKIQANTSKDR